MRDKLKNGWARFFMRYAGTGASGRLATRLAALFTPPYYARLPLARMNPCGYVSPRATVHHSALQLGRHVFIDDDVIIFEDTDGRQIELGDGVHLWRGNILQTGAGGRLSIGARTHVQPNCQFAAYRDEIRIGCDVQIAPRCAFYPYDHGIAAGLPVSAQPLQTKGPIVIEDDAWLGVGVIVLSGVRIGKGVVVGAGSVVNRSLPDGSVAAGVPAHVIRMRGN